MRRILITTSTFPLRLDDGRVRFVYDLARSLSQYAQVIVLVPGAPGAPAWEDMEGVEVHRFVYFWPRRAQCLAYGVGMREQMRASLLAKLQIPTLVLAQAMAIGRLVRRYRIDVINTHWMVPSGLATALALSSGVKSQHLLHLHAADVYFLRNVVAGRHIARFIVRRANSMMADGSHVRDSLSELLGYACEARLQPMGVYGKTFGESELEAHTIPSEAREFQDGFILFVGRLVEKKGGLYLIRAMSEILRYRPGVGLIMIGTGPEKDRLIQEVRQRSLANNVRFIGQQPHEVIVRYLHTCRAAAVPSIIDRHGETEGMPTVVIEAMAAGVPVVGSAVDGIPDVIEHRQNGWLARQKDPADLAQKLLEAITTGRQSLVIQNALVTARQHDWDQVACNYMRWIESL